MGEMQGLGSSEEDDARIGDTSAHVSNGPGGTVQVHDGIQVPQQQSHNSVIRWERFLPTRSLKVLLVENDDSTRHVVSALLRNCSYEVTAVANGLQAWKILEDLNNHIDLVLTEVVMPILSGIGLLCKIMSHKTLKNLPVIMMSSHDSMGIVFKCLSKGAVDFLVKPIRKNELKNLWQHIWRRCHSSSGSGSESGTQTKKSAKIKSNEESENNSDSSDELGDNGSNGPSNRDGSDNGSGTQSSWTKRTVDFDSPRSMSPACQLSDAPDSTCAQVIHTKPETLGNRWVHVTDAEEFQEKENRKDVAMGKDLEMGVCITPNLRHDYQCENSTPCLTSNKKNKIAEVDGKPVENEKMEHTCENVWTKVRDQTPRVSVTDVNSVNPQVESKKFGASNGRDTLQLKDRSCCDEEFPYLELSLKGLRGVGESGTSANDDRNILRHSDLSAFSKYNTASSANQGPTGNAGSCAPLDNSSDVMKMETTHNIPFHLSGTVLNQQSNGSSNDNDMASTAKKVTPKAEAFNDKLESTSAFKSFQSPASLPPQNTHNHTEHVIPAKEEDAGVKKGHAQFRGTRQQIQVQHHHHHHHYHHHVHNIQQHQSLQDLDDVAVKSMSTAVQCGSSNVVGGPPEANAGKYSMNGSASGSNHGSNGQDGSSTGLNTGLTNIESDNTAAGNDGAGDMSGNISGSAVDDHRVMQREAALYKFRQKRKERCFEKRVRYQSRKKLAEQRPRVKGQFVRQTIRTESKSGMDCLSDDMISEDNSCDKYTIAADQKYADC